MADNIQLNLGTGGDVSAADDISGVKFSRVKLTLGADGTNDGDVATGNPMPVRQVGYASGGCDLFRSLDLDESEEEVKSSAGTVYGCWFTNTATATRWLKFYNATAANVTVGSTTPVLTIGLPGNSTDDISGMLQAGGMGINFSTAITVAATTGVADNDTGAPAANDVIVNIFYK
jgi:hypothetical protein